MPIVVEHGPSLALAGSVSYESGRKAGAEDRRRRQFEETLRQQQAELQKQQQLEQQRQFNLNLQDRLDARTRDEQRFLLSNAFQQQRDQQLFQQNLLRDNIGFERDVGLGLLRQAMADDRDANLFAQRGVADAEQQVGLIEQQLAQAPLTPQGSALKSEMLGKLQSIRKQRSTLRPAQYLDLLNQWAGEYQSSGIQNHVQPPPDPYEIFGGFRQNPETGELEFNQGKQVQYLPTGQIAMPDGKGGITTRDIPSAILERVSPRALSRMLNLPESDILPSGGASSSVAAPIAPFTTAEGFDSAAFAKVKDQLRKEVVPGTGDQSGYEVPKYRDEAELDNAAYRMWYAQQDPRRRPLLLLQGVASGDLTVKDVQEMGYGGQLVDAAKQAIMAGELNPAQAQQLGFDVSVSDHGLGVRLRHENSSRQPDAPRVVPKPGNAPAGSAARAGQKTPQSPSAAAVGFRPESVSPQTREHPLGKLATAMKQGYKSNQPQAVLAVQESANIVLMVLDQYGDDAVAMPPAVRAEFIEAMKVLRAASQ